MYGKKGFEDGQLIETSKVLDVQGDWCTTENGRCYRLAPAHLEASPILEQWEWCSLCNGVSGLVYGKPGFPDGEWIRTSEIPKEGRFSTHVVTKSGSMYMLGTPKAAQADDHNARVARVAEAKLEVAELALAIKHEQKTQRLLEEAELRQAAERRAEEEERQAEMERRESERRAEAERKAAERRAEMERQDVARAREAKNKLAEEKAQRLLEEAERKVQQQQQRQRKKGSSPPEGAEENEPVQKPRMRAGSPTRRAKNKPPGMWEKLAARDDVLVIDL